MEQLADFILQILMGMGGIVPIVNYLKQKLNLNGFKAVVLTAVVSVVFGILSLWQNGELLEVSWVNFGSTFLTVFFASQFFYRLVKN